MLTSRGRAVAGLLLAPAGLGLAAASGALGARLRLAQLGRGFAFGAQVFGGAGEVACQGAGEQRLVAFDGGQHGNS